jgi:hypothetical protein
MGVVSPCGRFLPAFYFDERRAKAIQARAARPTGLESIINHFFTEKFEAVL